MGLWDRWREGQLQQAILRAKQSVGWLKPKTDLPSDWLEMEAGQLATKAVLFRRKLIAQFGDNYAASIEPYVNHLRRQREHLRQTEGGSPGITEALVSLLTHWIMVENRDQGECVMLLAAWAELDARGAS